MKVIATHLVFIFLLVTLSATGQSNYFITEDGYVYFISEAPLETIEAESTELRGVVQPSSNKFAFSLRIYTFEGFNSPLQQEHFNENYMESHQYEKATFQGKIIEEVNYKQDTMMDVRAKGTLTIHGESQDRIIPSQLQVSGDKIVITANFTVLLSDHDIHIPRIVKQKISEEIKVEVEATLHKKVE